MRSSTGGVDCWGNDSVGEVGNGTTGGSDGVGGYDTPQAVTGITNAVSTTGNYEGYCAVLSTGGVKCWGDDESGELGNGTDDGAYDTPQAVTGITKAVSLAADGNYAMCAVLSTGGVDCWGDNGSGEVGNGTVGGPDGDGDYDTPQAATGITKAVSITGEYAGFCAALSTGGVDCWGDNGVGEIGNGTVDGPDNGGYDTPQAVTGLTNARSVTSDEAEDYCAVLSTGAVDCWGDNLFGEVGNGNPGVDYDDTPQAATGITNAVSVIGEQNALNGGFCAVLATGAADCWGDNTDGEIGNGTTGGPGPEGGYDAPQAVTGITKAVSAASGGYFGVCAVLSNGAADCWGDNQDGEIGNGTVDGPDNDGYDTPQAVISAN